MLITGIILFIFLLGIWDYLHKKHRNEILLNSKIPGAPSWPIIGGALAMRGPKMENPIEYFRKIILERGKISYIWIFSQLSIMYANPKDLEVLLSSQTLIEKNNVYDMLSDWLGNGLLMTTGKKWHTRRKIITPTFHFKILEQFVDIFDRQGDILVDKLREFADGETIVDMFPFICLTALDIIGETAMGVQLNAQMQPNMGYTQAVKEVTSLISARLRKPLWRFDLSFRLTAPNEYKNLLKNIDMMKSFTKKVIQQRRQILTETMPIQNEEKVSDDMDDIGTKKRLALLDVLLQATIDGKSLSDEDIREEVETFMFAGHDTTTSGTSFTLYLISRHPDIQQKIYEEICEVIGDDPNKPITLRQLQDLKYLECVLKESMRLYPPVPIIGRYFQEDVVINDRVIPGKSHINIPFFVVFRDPDNFDDPNTFKPERFYEENGPQINPFAYTPFSAGPRNCIGQRYAILEMKANISKILRNYILLPLGEEVDPILSLVMRSNTGTKMGLLPRIHS